MRDGVAVARPANWSVRRTVGEFLNLSNTVGACSITSVSTAHAPESITQSTRVHAHIYRRLQRLSNIFENIGGTKTVAESGGTPGCSATIEPSKTVISPSSSRPRRRPLHIDTGSATSGLPLNATLGNRRLTLIFQGCTSSRIASYMTAPKALRRLSSGAEKGTARESARVIWFVPTSNNDASKGT